MAYTQKETQCKDCEEIHRQGLLSQPPRISKAGKIVLGIGATVAAVIYGITVPFVLPGFRRICLPFVPATESQINNVIKCLKGRSGSIIDLGSGDGRILNTIMLHQAQHDDMSISNALGVELNTWLVLYSKYAAWRSTTTRHCVTFRKQDIFKTDLRSHDNIVVFGVESLMEALEPKLNNELADRGMLIACRFPLPRWTPVYEEGDGIDKVWVYNRTSIPNSTAV